MQTLLIDMLGCVLDGHLDRDLSDDIGRRTIKAYLVEHHWLL